MAVGVSILKQWQWIIAIAVILSVCVLAVNGSDVVVISTQDMIHQPVVVVKDLQSALPTTAQITQAPHPIDRATTIPTTIQTPTATPGPHPFPGFGGATLIVALVIASLVLAVRKGPER